MLLRMAFFLALIVILPYLASASGHCTTIIPSLPYTINQSGTYCLNQSFSPISPPSDSGAINVNAQATLDCQGNSVAGTAGLDTYGIYVNRTSFSVIKNCVVSSFDNGIFVSNGNNTTLTNDTAIGNTEGLVIDGNGNRLENNTARLNDGNGFLLDVDSRENTVLNNTAMDNTLDGFSISSASYNLLRSNIAENNSAGFSLLITASHNRIEASIARKNIYGFYVLSSHNNTLSLDAAENNTQGFRLSGGSVDNTIAYGDSRGNAKGFVLVSGGNVLLSSQESQSPLGIDVCSSNNIIERLSSSSGKGVSIGDCAEANNTLIKDSTISSLTHVSSSGSFSYLINTSVSSFNVTGGSVYAQYYLNVSVSDPFSSPLSAAVSATDSGGYTPLNPTAPLSLQTDVNGVAKAILTSSRRNSTTVIAFGNYSIAVSRSGYDSNSSSLNLTGNTFLAFVLFPSQVPQPPPSGGGSVTTTTLNVTAQTTTTTASSTTTTTLTSPDAGKKAAEEAMAKAAEAAKNMSGEEALEALRLLDGAQRMFERKDYVTARLLAEEALRMAERPTAKKAEAKAGEEKSYSLYIALIALLLITLLFRQKQQRAFPRTPFIYLRLFE